MMKKFLRALMLVILFMSMAGIGAYLALTLIIRGEDTVIVPDLAGKEVLYGLETLSDLGLNTRVKGTQYHNQVPKNHVIDQDPVAGTVIKRGRDVKIWVSRGPETVVMPNLTGLTLQQSRIVLTENGLCQGTLGGMHTHRHPAGQVMAQYPLSGATVSRSACVDLLISRGATLTAFAMQELTGFSLETAIRRLEQLQLTVGKIHGVNRADAPLETIVDQMPMAGYRVTAGMAVDLTVNRSSNALPPGVSRNTDQTVLFRFALENGFLNKHMQVKLNHAQVSIDLFDDFVPPGREIWLLVPKSDNSTVLVYVDGRLVESRIMDGR